MTNQEEIKKTEYFLARTESSTRMIMAAIEAAAEANDGVIPDSLANVLSQLEGERTELLVGGIGAAENLKAAIASIREMEKKLAERRLSMTKALEGLKEYLRDSMKRSDEKKIELYTGEVISLRKNPPKVIIDNEEDIPMTYKKIIQEIKVDKTAIKKVLQAGGDISGAHLEQGVSVRW